MTPEEKDQEQVDQAHVMAEELLKLLMKTKGHQPDVALLCLLCALAQLHYASPSSWREHIEAHIRKLLTDIYASPPYELKVAQ